MASTVNQANVLDQLERIVSSKDFQGSARTKSFLEHLVRLELEGRGDELRGTALAMDVFGRGADFDPNVDPIVRIEAVKLRKALHNYYLTAGSADPVLITIPKGQYRPHFDANSEKSGPDIQSPPESAWPVLGICAFTGSDTPRARLFRDGLPEEIGLELSRFGYIRVLTGYPGELANEAPELLRPHCDYLLGGTVREEAASLRLIVQLKRTSDSSLAWSGRRDINQDDTDTFGAQEEISKQCAVILADAYGVVATDAAEQFAGRQASDKLVFEALLAFHAHLRTSRSGSLKQMVDLAKIAVQGNDASGLAHALMALGYIEEVALGQKRLGAILSAGQAHADKAVALEPQCPEALYAAAIYSQVGGDNPRFQRLIDAASRANPNGALLTALTGAWIALVGDIKLGGQMVRQAMDANPMLPIWTNITLCLEDVENGDYISASEKVRLIDAREYASDWLLIAAIHGLAGETQLAQQALSKIPTRHFTLEEYLDDLPYSSGLVEMLREGTGILRSTETGE